MAKKNNSEQRRWTSYGYLMGGLFVSAALSQANVQVFSRDHILAEARISNRLAVGRTEYARRGTIYSSDHKILAQSDDTYELGIDYKRVPESPAFMMALAAAADLPESEISQPGLTGEKSRVWRKHLSSEQAKQVNDVKVSWRADGVSLHRTLRREYPLGELASGVIGAVKDGIASCGLELSQNNKLKGTDGYREGFVDRTGAFLPMRMEGSATPKVNGHDVELTIDSGLQLEAGNAIRKAVESNKASQGVAIIIDPATGNILAMANWPSFDPIQVPKDGVFNPCFMGAFEPGSTFKILTLAKALDLGVIGDNNHVYCKGELAYNDHWRIHCDAHHGNRAHGDLDNTRAISKSCNVSAATWALKIGYDNMVKFLDDSGLLNKTTLGVPLERGGLFNRHEYAKQLQLMTVGFGQSMSATPIGLASAFAMLGNEGERMTPRLIASIDGKATPIQPAGQLVKPETANKVLGIMQAVIQTDEGTGASLRIPGYRLAGKTGTAQKVNPKNGQKGGGYVSSFVGFVPAEKPQAMILVMVDNPKGGSYYGAAVAGPVFKDLARAVIRTKKIEPTENSIGAKVGQKKGNSAIIGAH